MRRVLLVLQLATWLGVALAADGAMAETERIGPYGAMAETERIGPYQLERVAEGLEIRTGASVGLRGVLGVAAVLCLVGAVALAALVPNGLPSVLVGAVGLALALVAGRVPSGPDRLRLSETEVVVHGFVGQQGTTRTDQIRAIEVQRRTPTGAETKRSPQPRVWQVTLRGMAEGTTIARLRVVSQSEAITLAARIGAVLDRPVVERDGLAR